jgi:hypothetical protein
VKNTVTSVLSSHLQKPVRFATEKRFDQKSAIMAKTTRRSSSRSKKRRKPTPSRARRRRVVAKEPVMLDDEAHIDACDVDFSQGEQTPDSALPPAKGGVEILRKTGRRSRARR